MKTTIRALLWILPGLECCCGWSAVDRDPVQVGQWPAADEDATNSITAVHVEGDLAYVTGHDAMHVLDISDPANPERIGHYRSPHRPDYGVQWMHSGTLTCAAYHLDNQPYLEVVDLSEPANPQRRAAYEPGFLAESAFLRSAFLFGNRVYLTFNWPYSALGWRGGFEIVDISDRSNPQRAGSYVTSGLPESVHAVGDHVYLSFCC